MRRSPSPGLRTVLSLSIACTLLALACHDVTAPPLPAPPPDAAVVPSTAPDPVVVSAGDLKGWAFIRPTTGKPCIDTVQCRLVNGPAAPPIGTGSVELAASRGSDASVTLNTVAGTRLSRITALRYSTYRQSADKANSAAIALELTVQYNAGGRTENGEGQNAGGEGQHDDDQGHTDSDVGVLVFEPGRTAAGRVPKGAWKTWDARAGLWWSTRQAEHEGQGPTTRPCVQLRPCTWGDILARFPNAALKAVSLTARRADDFRGNADSLVVGIDRGDMVFDFELEARRVRYPLTRIIGDGLMMRALPTDTLYTAGAIVPYAFTALPGHRAPLVVLDDSLAPASGRIVMNGPHSLEVVSDTILARETLSPVEEQLAALTQQLMNGPDKLAAAGAYNAFVAAQLAGGTTPEALAHAADVADHVVVDLVRDSAAIRAVDEALAGHQFTYERGDAGQLVTGYSAGTPASLLVAPRAPSLTLSTPAAIGTRPRAGRLAPTSSARTIVEEGSPENPSEKTTVIYTNGIQTFRGGAFTSAALLAKLLFAEPRFRNGYTSVIFYYNPTHVVQMADYDRAHPCVARYASAIGFTSSVASMVDYAACKGTRFLRSTASQDIVEAMRARMEFNVGVPASTEVVTGLTHLIAGLRAAPIDSHVLLVGHSEGTILQAQAVQALPSLEHHELEVANRCVGVLALAPATVRSRYGMDEYHLSGLLARFDIIRFTLPFGWEDVETPFTELARLVLARNNNDPLTTLIVGTIVHSVSMTYLTGNVATMVVSRLAAIHRECIAGSSEVIATPSTVALGNTFSASVRVWNQNGRVLLGRKVDFWETYGIDQIDSVTFRAMTPSSEPWQLTVRVARWLWPGTVVTIPLVQFPFTIKETFLGQWVGSAAANGPGGTWSVVGGPPTTPWDGAPSSCGQTVRYTGVLENWVEYQLLCSRTYTAVFDVPKTLITGRPVLGSAFYATDTTGALMFVRSGTYLCEGAYPCIRSGYAEWIGQSGVVGRSLLVTPTLSPAASASPSGIASMPQALPSGAQTAPYHSAAEAIEAGRAAALRFRSRAPAAVNRGIR